MNRRTPVALTACLALLGACSPTPTSPSGSAADELVFLRSAVLAPPGSGGRLVGDGTNELVEHPWSPGDSLVLGGVSATAPVVPECVGLFGVELGDVSRLVAMGGASPDTGLAFSPDGSKLAIGSYRGEVLVVDGWTGEPIARRRLAETMVKQVAWSPDGATLYAAEQSPDALVAALDPASLETRWSVRLADEVGSSPAPDGEDLYGVYTLPAAFELVVLEGGDLIVGASHGWNTSDGPRHNRARILRLRPDGSLAAAWPPDGTADATLNRLRLDEPGGLLITAVGRTASGPPPSDIAVGGAQVLRLEDLSVVAGFVPPILAPHFKATFIWEGLDVDAARNLGVVALADGRAFGFPLSGDDEPWEIEVSTPILAGDVPISASIGYGLLFDDDLVVQTSDTNVPYGSASAASRPPSPHPHSNTLAAYGPDRTLRWTWTGEHLLNGLVVSADGRTGVAGTRARNRDQREDLFGALLFRLDGVGTGAERLEAVCPTEGPVFFRSATTSDGRVAVAEHPFLRDDGSHGGRYRVTVLR